MHGDTPESSDDYNLNIIKKYIDKINSQKNKKKTTLKPLMISHTFHLKPTI